MTDSSRSLEWWDGYETGNRDGYNDATADYQIELNEVLPDGVDPEPVAVASLIRDLTVRVDSLTRALDDCLSLRETGSLS